MTVCLRLSIQAQFATANPVAIPPVGWHQLNVLSPTVLELILINSKEPGVAPQEWNFVGENFVPNLPAPTAFSVTANGSPVTVAQVGFKRRPLYAPLKKRDLRVANSLYLVLAQPVSEGHNIVVRNLGGAIWNDSTVSYTATASPLRFNPAIHVNQVGYQPQFSKKAMVGHYLGSLGELPVSATTFSIVDAASGTPVFNGQLTLRADVGYTYTATPYQKVYEADFSAFTQTGEFRLKVPGMGASYPFLINEGASAAFARAYALGLYHQRCGTSNALPFTRHEHGDCHAADASVPTMAFATVNSQIAKMSYDYASFPGHTAPQLKDVSSSLYPFVRQGAVNVRGGHHDAGDYSKYTINSAGLIHHLVFAADSFPGVAALDNLGLPESGDGKSDILQEAKWEADFLAKMQDSDGGFYFLVYPRDRAYEDNVLPDHGDPQVVFPKTTAVTAAAVGALAEMGSSPTFKAQFPTEAALYMQQAHAGWNFLTNALAQFGANGSYQKVSHYGNEFLHRDEIAWAAAAMFAATGDQIYAEQLKTWFDPASTSSRRWTWWRLFEGYGCAARAYAFAVRSGRLTADKMDPVYLAKVEAEIIAAGDDIERFARETAYGTSFPDPSKRVRTAGWFFSSERAFELATAHQIQPSPAYLTAILSNLGYEGGCNPVNMTYITGLGFQRSHDIVHQYAQNDSRVLPPSGIPLGNIQGGFPYLDNYKTELGQLGFPADGATQNPYPYYDRYTDAFNTTTEFVVMDQARALATAAFLMAQTAKASEPSRFGIGQIIGLPVSVPAEENVTATFVVPGVDLSQAKVVWEAVDQQPFLGQTHTFAAKSAGEQWVEVEAQLPDGTRYFGRANFTATYTQNVAANAFQSTPLSVSPDTAALFNFDDGLSDAAGRVANLALEGGAHLDTSNIGWMSQRAGSALRFHDLGDKATVTIPSSILFTNGQTTEITVEAMVFVKSYKGWARGPGEIVSLYRDWDASLRFMEDTWSGAHVFGGNEFDLTGSTLSSALTLEKWHHLSMSISSTGYSVRVNGQTIGTKTSGSLFRWGHGSAALQLGNFDGWIDEVVVRTKGPLGPAMPTGVAATPTVSRVTLSWDSSPGATAYLLYRSTNPEGPFLRLNGTTGLAFADLNVVNGTTYHYQVAAYNSLGESARSPVVSARPDTAPAAPTNLTAIKDGAVARIRWTDASSNETAFYVERSLSGAGTSFVRVGTLPANATEFTDASAPQGGIYYRVFAANAVGARVCAPALASPLAAPSAPAQFQATALSTSQIRLSWVDTAMNELGYVIYRSLDDINMQQAAVLAPDSQSWSDTGLAAATTYYYYVAAFHSDAQSIGATSSAKTFTAEFPAPTGVAATPTTSRVTISWNAAPGATAYLLYRGTNPEGPFLRLSGTTSLAFADVNVVNGTTYYYQVTAYNAGGESARSPVVSARPDTAPAAPTNVTAIKEGAATRLRWTDASTNESEFYVEGSLTGGGASFVRLGALPANATEFVDEIGWVYYRVFAVNAAGARSSTIVKATP